MYIERTIFTIACFVATVVGTRYFPGGAVWFKDVSTAPVDPNSQTIIKWLTGNGGWGNGKFQVDFSFNILSANASTPFAPLHHSPGYYTPDCDNITTFPLPPGGAIEGQTGYTCDASQNDCHLLVVDSFQNKIYESYQTNVVKGTVQSVCAITWNMCYVYPNSGRGDQCTSTDAAGFPITQLLFTADEVASGTIDHAIRFILPNPRMEASKYVHPASHAGGPMGPPSAPPYGVHFRLKASFDASPYSASARVVIAALKKYGMFLADGGNVALTAAGDTYTVNKWDTIGFNSNSLAGIHTTDFDVISSPDPPITVNDNCVLNSIRSTCSTPQSSNKDTYSNTN